MIIPVPIVAAAQAAQRFWRIPARVSIGQYGLESAWGKAEPIGSNNPFGIKAKPGQPFVLARTREEHADGSSYYIMAPFEKFATVAEAFNAHAKLLATAPVYHAAMALLPDVDAFVTEMARHYATAHDYATELLHLIAVDGLAQFDLAPVPAPPPPAPPVNDNPTPQVSIEPGSVAFDHGPAEFQNTAGTIGLDIKF